MNRPAVLLLSLLLFAGCTTPDAGDCSSMPTITNFAGLWTNPNPLNVPPGAARAAWNVVSTRPGAAECRPGQETLSGTFATSGERLRSGMGYGGYNFEHTGVSLYRRTVSTGALTKVADNVPAGAANVPAGAANARMRFAVAGDDLYMATGSGVKVMDGATGTPSTPGMECMPDMARSPAVITSAGVTWLAAGATVAYRAVLMRNDAQGRVVQGAPSARSVYLNTTASTAHLDVDVFLPASAQAGDYLQVFRTSQAASGADPGDTMGLVYEAPITSAQITAKEVIVSDITPDVMIGAPLYTNGTQEGIGFANNQPPLAEDIAYFRQNLVLANVTYPHRLRFQWIGAKTGTGSTINFSLDGHGFAISIGTYATVSEAVTAAARLFVFMVNNNAATWGIRATYVSGENDPPGIIALERTTPTAGAFTLQCTAASNSTFVPDITTSTSSTQDKRLNGLDISKAGLPYAFPSDSRYHLRLGAADKKILRVVANRDSLFAFKEDGIWRVYQAGDAWGYTKIHEAILKAPDSCAVMDNQIIAVTDIGIIAVDEGGVGVISDPVKNYVQAILDGTLSGSSGPSDASMFAVADPKRFQYTFWYSSGAVGITSDAGLVYNAGTDNPVWTQRDDATTGGYIGVDGLLYLGSATSNTVTRQRNTGTASDYKGPANEAIPFEIDWIKLDGGNAGGVHQFTELRLLTEEPTEGPYTFTFTNHYGESEACTPEGEGLCEVRVWVPDGMQRTTRLGVKVERDVLEEYFVVLGMRDMLADYDGPPAR
jgi:hypothetical protein